ncbi:MAG: cysteine--tRNA ligase [Myxococcales bacterium]|nr:cysteine--tRNA ligase [Myxococcales bacterium]
MALRLHDTLTGEKRDFEPLEPGKVKMYVCGVTPYDKSHLGHARCYVAWDVVYRYLRHSGYAVTYVRNFTDVDDKIIARANERGMDPLALAQENIDFFYADMDALGIARPDVEPRVSGTIDEIIAMVQRLESNGIAYAVDGDVYYEVDAFKDYGKLSKRPLDEMKAGARVEVDTRKRNPMDFALWKSAKPGEPTWDSPWGPGRPGWHIECSAMSTCHLGETFDIHAGGRDLIFPHHENEIAQSEGATGQRYVNYWLHNGFINIDDEKMSKSLGNFFTIADIRERYTATTLRYFLMTARHYRGPINFSDAMLEEAAGRVAYFYDTLQTVEAFLDGSDDLPHFTGPLPHQDVIDTFEARFTEAMDDDFSVPRAMEPVHEAFRALNELANTRKAKRKAAAATAAAQLLAKVRKVDAVLNLFGHDPAEYLQGHRLMAAARAGLSPAWIDERLEARRAARAAKLWDEADAVRDELAAKGVVIMDRPNGQTDWAIEERAAEGAEASDAGDGEG